MIEVNIEVQSIRMIEEAAAKAFAAGLPDTANPYPFISPSRRIWMLHYEKCERFATTKDAS